MKTLQDEQKASLNKSQKLAIYSACYGTVSEVMIQESAVIILFAGMLGAGSMLAMLTTSLFGVMRCLLLLPAAYAVARIGYKRSIINSSHWGALVLLLLAFSPFLGQLAKYGMIINIIIFASIMTIYVAAWFPFLDEFLPKKDRSHFFGMLRFSWQSCSLIFFFICGLAMGKQPDLWILQTIIIISAAALLGRAFYAGKIKVSESDRKALKFRHGLNLVMENKPLVGFSVYIAFLYLAAQGTVPLTYIYLKNYLHIPDNIVVIISSLTLGGTMIGFLFAARIISKIGVKKMLLMIHISFAAINFMLFAFSTSGTTALVIITALLICYGFFIATSSVAVSSEMMALANPDNKAMAMAFCVSMCAAGMGGARLLSSVIIGSGILAAEWSIGTAQFTMFHTMYLGYAIAILFVCVLLVIVPAIFPKDSYQYTP